MKSKRQAGGCFDAAMGVQGNTTASACDLRVKRVRQDAAVTVTIGEERRDRMYRDFVVLGNSFLDTHPEVC